MIRLIKDTVNSIIVYIWDEDVMADTLRVWTKHSSSEKKIVGELPYNKDKIDYLFSGFSNFIDYNVDFFPFEVEFLKDNKVVKNVTVSTTNYKLKPFQRGVYRVKRQEFYIKAKNVNGMRLLLFKKQNKEHCPDCWDEDYKSSNNSNCKTCGGTGYVDKYSLPVFSYGFYFNDQPVDSPTIESGKQPLNPAVGNNAYITLLPDIVLTQSDLIYSIDIGDLSIIHKTTLTLFNNNPISQKVFTSSLPTNSNAYKAIKENLHNKMKEVMGGIGQ